MKHISTKVQHQQTFQKIFCNRKAILVPKILKYSAQVHIDCFIKLLAHFDPITTFMSLVKENKKWKATVPIEFSPYIIRFERFHRRKKCITLNRNRIDGKILSAHFPKSIKTWKHENMDHKSAFKPNKLKGGFLRFSKNCLKVLKTEAQKLIKTLPWITIGWSVRKLTTSCIHYGSLAKHVSLKRIYVILLP